ncbi:anti-sigma factor [Jannaschia formosa]|uniref:anti-sigma factor n=1 Tax=Jannaschia formosa TaxID=2259592 RepID=UPI001074A99D|nr:anti-sigma factor [Jannaschia formosa]TFL16240.1 hypothetical protein DR046_20990 [Jannaschia formosa]
MTLSEDDIATAAEHALHLDEGTLRAAARRRLVTDPEFRAEVAFWEEALAATWDEVPEIAPPARVRRRLRRRLFGRPPKPFARLLPWLLAGTAAAALAVAALRPELLVPPRGPAVVAEIATEGDGLRVLAAWDPAAGAFRIRRLTGPAPAGRDYELWAIPPDGGAPVSLGLLPEAGPAPLPETLRPDLAGLVLAVSEEPEGGSPTGAPTTVLAAAPVTSF